MANFATRQSGSNPQPLSPLQKGLSTGLAAELGKVGGSHHPICRFHLISLLSGQCFTFNFLFARYRLSLSVSGSISLEMKLSMAYQDSFQAVQVGRRTGVGTISYKDFCPVHLFSAPFFTLAPMHEALWGRWSELACFLLTFLFAFTLVSALSALLSWLSSSFLPLPIIVDFSCPLSCSCHSLCSCGLTLFLFNKISLLLL